MVLTESSTATCRDRAACEPAPAISSDQEVNRKFRTSKNTVLLQAFTSAISLIVRRSSFESSFASFLWCGIILRMSSIK